MTTIKISKTIEEEIQIEFPAYYEHAGVVKIISPDTFIKAYARGGQFAIQKIKNMPNVVEMFVTEGTPITKEEFMAGLEKALNHANYETFMESHETESREEIREVLYDNMQLANSINNVL